MRKLLAATATAALLLMALVLPANAAVPQPFSAAGSLCLSALPTGFQAIPTAAGLLLRAQGEQIAGSLDTSSWAGLPGATVLITIEQEVSFFDPATGTFGGEIHGQMAVAGSVNLSGTFRGSVSGTFGDLAGLPGSVDSSTALVSWSLRGDGVSAVGTASASFADTEGGFCGPLALAGRFSG